MNAPKQFYEAALVLVSVDVYQTPLLFEVALAALAQSRPQEQFYRIKAHLSEPEAGVARHSNRAANGSAKGDSARADFAMDGFSGAPCLQADGSNRKKAYVAKVEFPGNIEAAMSMAAYPIYELASSAAMLEDGDL